MVILALLGAMLLQEASAAQLKADPAAFVLEGGAVMVRRPVSATQFPGLCQQEILRVTPQSPSVVEREITFRNVLDARPQTAAGPGYRATLAAACSQVPDVTTKAPDARTAWLAALAVEFLRDELANPQSERWNQTCIEGSGQCRDTRLLLDIFKRDQMIRIQPVDCAGDGSICLEAIGFFDPYASKVRGQALFVEATFRLDGAGDTWSLRSAALKEVLLSSDDG